jgi:DinB superfamily
VKDTEETALALLEATPVILRALLARLPQLIVTADLDRGWSPKRVLAHFVDVESVFAERLHAIVEENRPLIRPIDPLATLNAGDYLSRTVDALLDELGRSRRETCDSLRTPTAGQLERPAEHDSCGEITASNLLHYWPYHDTAHIRQIQRMLQAVLGHELGNAAEFDI